MKTTRTHYQNLQVAENASLEVIKGAYRALTQKWHPDKNPDRKEEAERNSKIINAAYVVLSDPAARREYDRTIAAQRDAEAAAQREPDAARARDAEAAAKREAEAAARRNAEAAAQREADRQAQAARDQRQAEAAERRKAEAAQPPPTAASQPDCGVDHDDIVYAGFTRRFEAFFLDQILLAVAVVILFLLAGIPFGVLSGTVDQARDTISNNYSFLYWVVAPFYFAGMESSRYQATLGKRALGIKVTDDAGLRLSFVHALGRWFAAALSYLSCYIGFVMAASTERKRALHDIVASTLVVDRWAYTEHPERQQRRPSTSVITIAIAMCLVPVILVAIAVLKYQDYIIRSQVSEGVSLADGVKTAVAEFYFNVGHFPASNASAGMANAASINGAYVSQVQIDAGQIRVLYSSHAPQHANAALDGSVLVFSPVVENGAVHWTCGSTNIQQKHLSAACSTGQTTAPATNPPEPAQSVGEAAPQTATATHAQDEVGATRAADLQKGIQAWQRGDFAAALAEFRPLAKQGDAVSQASLGWMYDQGQGVPVDYTTALTWYRKSAAQANAPAQYNLGTMYANGHGVPKDDAEAFAWFRKAAAQGFAQAQYSLGAMYASGQGVSHDDAEAVAWFRKAAAQGYADAQYSLGVEYRDGHGVRQDYTEALGWFRKAAAQGTAAAQNNIGAMYTHGQGVAVDYSEALAWYRKAVAQGFALAQYNLGAMYRDGEGVPKNIVVAYALFNISASIDGSSNNPATSNRTSVMSGMTAAQITAGQALTRQMQRVGVLQALDAR